MDTIWQPVLHHVQGPKYKAVAQSIRDGVATGELLEGAKLPPVRDLAWRLGITPGTVARAYTILTDEGMLNAEVGRGTFVAPKRSFAPLFAPIEVDAAIHNAEAQTYNVNLFSPHLPSVGQAPLIRQLLSDIAHDPPSGVMHYPSRQTSQKAREAAVQWLKNAPLGAFREGDLTLTNGGQNAILIVLQAVLMGRKPTILVEELAYPGFRRAAELLRVNVVPVAMDDDGIIPEALAAACQSYEAQVLCTSPEVHNPTCGFTPEYRREQIVAVARKHDLQILEDDCYRMGAAVAPTYRMLAPERGWYVASISKTVTPALRIGIAVAPEGKGSRLRRAAEHSFFGLATPITDLAARLLTHPQLDALTTKARMGTNTYVESAVNILGGYDLKWRMDVPFLWLKLPEGWRAGAFCQAAEAQGVQIRPAEEFACRDARVPHAIRFAINAGVSLASFEAAIHRLRELLDNPHDQIGV
ncbi:MAG: DNA-binding transcriptional MocR family regulator [Ascidiaceihabitans sp.]|jgi:DNA-binding transcriptional MocR family regulator